MKVPAYNSPPVGLKQQNEFEANLYISRFCLRRPNKAVFPNTDQNRDNYFFEDKMNIKYTHPAETKMK